MTRRTVEIAAFCAALLLAALAFHAWLASRDERQRLQSTLATQKQLIDSAAVRERTRDATLQDALAQIEKLKRDAQTPAQILRDLPKYLPLPQPITLAPAAPPAPPIPIADSSRQGIRSAGASVQQASQFPADSSAGQGTALPESVPSAPSSLSASLDSTASAKRPGSPQNPAPPLPAAPVAQNCPKPGPCVAQLPAADLKPLYDYVQDCRACQAQLAAAKQNAADDAAKIAALTRERDAAVTAAKGGSFLRRLRRNAEWFAVGALVGFAAKR
jgi:hypothetical protein